MPSTSRSARRSAEIRSRTQQLTGALNAAKQELRSIEKLIPREGYIGDATTAENIAGYIENLNAGYIENLKSQLESEADGAEVPPAHTILNGIRPTLLQFSQMCQEVGKLAMELRSILPTLFPVGAYRPGAVTTACAHLKRHRGKTLHCTRNPGHAPPHAYVD